MGNEQPGDVIVPGEGGGSPYLYPDPARYFDTALAGTGLATSIGEFIETSNPLLLGSVFSSKFEFIDGLSALINTPNQQTYDTWNTWSVNTGLAPGAVYIGYDADTGHSWFEIPLNSISGSTSGYQISWHYAENSTDTSGPIIDYF